MTLPALTVARADEAARLLRALITPGSPENLAAHATNTHFTPEGWQAGLERSVTPWADPQALTAAIEADLAGALPCIALPPRTALVVLGGVLPPSHLQAVLRPWLLGADVAVKPPASDPEFPGFLAASLPGVTLVARERVPALANEVDAVVAVGGDDAVRAIGRFVPVATPFLGYGDRLSIGVSDSTPPDAAVDGFADDVRLYDQRGCLSLRELWVRGDPSPLAARLAGRLRGSAVRPALGALEDRIRRFHDLAVMSGAEVHAEWSTEDGGRRLSWCVAVSPDDSPLPPGPGGRVVVVRAWRPGETRPTSPLSGVAVAGALSPDEAQALVGLGASRLVAPGQLQAAPPGWWQDQRRPFSGLCRYWSGT